MPVILWALSLNSYAHFYSNLARFPDHAEKMHELPDENLVPITKRIAIAQGTLDYKNILQNNGRIAH